MYTALKHCFLFDLWMLYNSQISAYSSGISWISLYLLLAPGYHGYYILLIIASSSGSASPTEAADEMCSFLVIKHSWKGKYKRLVIDG